MNTNYATIFFKEKNDAFNAIVAFRNIKFLNENDEKIKELFEKNPFVCSLMPKTQYS